MAEAAAAMAPAPTEALKVDVALQHEVEQFLFAEAALLDERRFEEWLSLFTADVHYLMPNRVSQMPRDARGSTWGQDGFPLFDDDQAALASRVKRLGSGAAWAEEPPSRTRHMISNVRLKSVDAETLDASLNFIVYRSRRERDEDFFVGARIDRLCRVDGSWQIKSRQIMLDQTVLTHHNLSIFF